MANGLVKDLQELKPQDAVHLPARDIRARKAPVRSALIRFDALRKLTRVVTLTVLDVAGVFLSIWTALELKAVINGQPNLTLSFHQTQDVAPLAILVTLLLFARSGLYSDRAVRPGFTRIVASLVQVTAIILAYAVVQGGHFASYYFSSFYIFWGSLVFALVYVSLFRWVFDRVSGFALRKAGYRRRAVIVGRGDQIDAVAHALGGGSDPPLDPVGFVSLTPRPENGLRNLGSLDR